LRDPKCKLGTGAGEVVLESHGFFEGVEEAFDHDSGLAERVLAGEALLA
jgi:hypothetical protein